MHINITAQVTSRNIIGTQIITQIITRRGSGNRHMAGQLSVDSDETNYTFNVEVMSSITEANKNEEETLKWILDSGCSDHIVNSDKYFSDFVTLKDPVKIKVCDDYSLIARKKGNIPMYFVVNGEFINILIKNVFYVPSIRHNLLSVSYTRIVIYIL